MVEHHHPPTRPAGGVAVEIKGLSFTYPDGTAALLSVDLAVAAGESLVVVGPNGAGKSTLLLTLNGLLKTDGAISINGRTMDGRHLQEIRRLVGVVFQDPEDQLFMPTVFDDVAFGPINMGLSEHDVAHRVADALALVGMAGFETRLSHHLSFGEKKLISMAAVLAMEPEVLVFDEPTANLDPRARRHLIAFLKALSQTKIISTHDMNFAYELADHVVILHDKRKVADGPAGRILTDETLLIEYGLELPTNIAQKSRSAEVRK